MTLAAIIAPILSAREDISQWTCLSLGCGMAVAESSYVWKHITGVDIWDYHKAPINAFIQCDIRQIRARLEPKTFDIVLALDIIEHLEKEEGFRLIEDVETIARKAVVFYTPLKWDTNEENMKDENAWCYGNPYNLHKSLWQPEDFKPRGYQIYAIFPGAAEPIGFLATKWL